MGTAAADICCLLPCWWGPGRFSTTDWTAPSEQWGGAQREQVSSLNQNSPRGKGWVSGQALSGGRGGASHPGPTAGLRFDQRREGKEGGKLRLCKGECTWHKKPEEAGIPSEAEMRGRVPVKA